MISFGSKVQINLLVLGQCQPSHFVFEAATIISDASLLGEGHNSHIQLELCESVSAALEPSPKMVSAADLCPLRRSRRPLL